MWTHICMSHVVLTGFCYFNCINLDVSHRWQSPLCSFDRKVFRPVASQYTREVRVTRSNWLLSISSRYEISPVPFSQRFTSTQHCDQIPTSNWELTCHRTMWTMSKLPEVAPSNHDPRLEYLGSYVTKSLRLKPEKWSRVLAIEDYRNILKDFTDKPTCLILIVVLTPSAQLIPTNSFPVVLKTKGVYFVKKTPAVIPKERCNEMIIAGEQLKFTPN